MSTSSIEDLYCSESITSSIEGSESITLNNIYRRESGYQRFMMRELQKTYIDDSDGEEEDDDENENDICKLIDFEAEECEEEEESIYDDDDEEDIEDDGEYHDDDAIDDEEEETAVDDEEEETEDVDYDDEDNDNLECSKNK